MRTVSSFIAAVIATYVLGAIFISQGNIASIIAMNFEVTMAQRWEAAVHDVTSMTDIYLALIAVSFVISLPVATLIIKKLPHLRMIGYVLAGAVGLAALHIIMKMVLGLSGIAPTRSIVGLLAQAVAGGVGGYLFHLMSMKRSAVVND